jgi:low affinity Fe/Cu permease
VKEVESSSWSVLRHPTERGGEGQSRFALAAETASNLASSSLFFSVCAAVVAVWAFGLVVGLPGKVESDLIGAMAAMTLMLVALLKNSERRAERAMQLKLDAIAAALLEGQSGRSKDQSTRSELEDAVRLHEEI